MNAPAPPRIHVRGVAVILAFAAFSAPMPGFAQAPGEASILSTYRSMAGVNNGPRSRPHAGVDFGDKPGAPVLAAADGSVERLIDYALGCGLGVVLGHAPFKRYTVYCHLRRALVWVGQTVARGETIGLVGASGNAFGVPHVHFEVCTSACSSHVDGDLWGTRDPLAVTAGCFDARQTYRRDRFVVTFPVECAWWAWEKYR